MNSSRLLATLLAVLTGAATVTNFPTAPRSAKLRQLESGGRYQARTPCRVGKYYFRVGECYEVSQAECDKTTLNSRKVRR